MKKRTFRLEDVLAVFRGLESNEDALIVLGDEDAMRVLIAWTHVDQEWSKPATREPSIVPGRLARVWSWVLSGWDVDSRKVSRLAGVSASVAHAKLEILMGNRLIYPDGSMSKGVRTVLMNHTATKLGIKQKAATPPMPKKTEEKKAKTDDNDAN